MEWPRAAAADLQTGNTRVRLRRNHVTRAMLLSEWERRLPNLQARGLQDACQGCPARTSFHGVPQSAAFGALLQQCEVARVVLSQFARHFSAIEIEWSAARGSAA